MSALGTISAHARYRVLVDGEEHWISKPEPTAWELLVAAGKSAPEEHVLYLTGGGHPTLLDAQERVSLPDRQTNTFISRHVHAAQGLGKGRRELDLPAADAEWLDETGLVYETISEAAGGRVILYRCPMPTGYTIDWTDVDLLLDPHYPRGPAGGVGFSPALTRKDGRTIRATCENEFDGRVWQSWLRERTDENPWRSSLDGLSTQFVLIEDWLSRELRRA